MTDPLTEAKRWIDEAAEEITLLRAVADKATAWEEETNASEAFQLRFEFWEALEDYRRWRDSPARQDAERADGGEGRER